MKRFLLSISGGLLSALMLTVGSMAFGQTMSSATYSAGNIASDANFTTTGGSSSCPGTLTVNVPVGETIYQVDVVYSMTAASGAYMSEQRSRINCVETANAEASLATGSGSTGGTFNYSRTIDIANGHVSTGSVDFVMHAGRTWGGSGCDASYNQVDDGTWTVTVYSAPCAPPSAFTLNGFDNDSAYVAWTGGGAGSAWNVDWVASGATPGTGAGTMNTPTAEADTITTLSPETAYDVYVQAICAADSSPWIGPLSFTTIPSCPEPTGLQIDLTDNDTSAVSWTTGYQENMWNIEWGLNGFTPGTGNAVDASNASGMPADTTGSLVQLTDYEVYVQADCGVDSSIWVGPASFTTLPNCPDVTALVVDSFAIDTAFVSWTSNGPETDWYISYGTTGTTAAAGTSIATTATNGVIPGLIAGETYDFYVRSYCGGTDTGVWQGPISFMMPCILTTPVTLPFTEDFEAGPDSAYIGNAVIVCQPDYNWTFETNNQTQGRLSFGTSAYAVQAGNGAAAFDVANNSNEAINFLTLTIDLSNYAASNNLFLSFDWTEYGDEADVNDRVWIRGSNTDTWLEIFDWSTVNPGNGDWQSANQLFISTLLLTNGQTPTSTFQVRFGQDDNFSFNSDGFIIDNVVIEEIDCPQPQNFASNFNSNDSIGLSWTAGFLETEWSIEYGPTGFTQGSGTTISTTSNPDTLTGFALNGVYDFYLQAACGSNDSSTWVGPITVATDITNDEPCGAIEVPVDGSTNLFQNISATSGGESAAGNSSNNTVWFKAVVPASGHMAIGTCDTPFDSELEVFTADSCQSYATYTSVGYADWNPWGCGGSHPAGIELCGLTPGDTVLFWVGAWSSGNSGVFPLRLWDLDYEAGTGSDVNVCEVDTLNLWNSLSGQGPETGNWVYPNNPNAIVNDSLFATPNATVGGDEVYYITSNSCMADTATVTVEVFGPSNAGIDGTIDACMNEPISLFSGLTGTVDLGGTWYDPSNNVTDANIFTASIGGASYNYDYIVSNGVCPEDTSNVVVTVDATCDWLSVDELTFGNIVMSPNPTTSSVFITNAGSSDVFNYELTDINGKVVASAKAAINGTEATEVNLETLQSGMYLIRVFNDNAQKTFRIIKE